jgi:hypothetical protein
MDHPLRNKSRGLWVRGDRQNGGPRPAVLLAPQAGVCSEHCSYVLPSSVATLPGAVLGPGTSAASGRPSAMLRSDLSTGAAPGNWPPAPCASGPAFLTRDVCQPERNARHARRLRPLPTLLRRLNPEHMRTLPWTHAVSRVLSYSANVGERCLCIERAATSTSGPRRPG